MTLVHRPPKRVPDGLAEVRSAAMRDVVERIRRCAGTGAPLMLLGETGTGKTSLARFAHATSRRAGPFVEFDCGSADPGMMRRDLHGHRKGKFTGAVEDGEGLYATAHRGTLFLDEVAELPKAEQPRLLRVVESGTTRRLGEVRERAVDVWIVSATNVEPRAAVASGTLRLDLFLRLAEFKIRIPPLRERPEDIPPLIDHWCAARRPGARVEPAVVDQLCRRRLSGNLPELWNTLNDAWLCRADGRVLACNLEPDPDRGATPAPADLAEVMRQAVAEAGSERAAAKALGWSWGRWRHHKERLKATFA